MSSRQIRSEGFTLIELLVAMVIGSIITTLLLFTVVQLLQTNQREAARSDTQREVQMALDYIARDLREAVYVYDGNCLETTALNGRKCIGLRSFLPNKIANKADVLPVLAFWRVDPLPKPLEDRCVANADAYSKNGAAQTTALQPIQDVPCVSRRMYTLVVYSLDTEKKPQWKGKARITRYQLPQYTYKSDAAIGGTPTTTPGWASPTGDTTFLAWPKNTDQSKDYRGGTSPNDSPEDAVVLIDFVDQEGIASSNASADTRCPLPKSNPAITPDPGYVLTPQTAAKRGFYVCVKGGDLEGKVNQEVAVHIQGNAAGRPGLNRDATSVPIPMETRVLTRGAVDKSI